MTSTEAPRLRWTGARALLGPAPWSARAWQVTTHVLVGGLVGGVAGCVIMLLAALAAGLSVTVVLAIGPALALFGCAHAFAALQRSRFEALLGERIDPPPAEHRGSWPRRLIAEARDEATWRQLGYHLFALVVGCGGAIVVALAWSGGFLLALSPLIGWLLPQAPVGAGRSVAACPAGIMLLFAAPWLARGLAAVDVLAGRSLLGRSSRAELARRVAALSRSRSELVEAADAERRRIERDLHDGMQQRLVALAMNLGLARASFPDAPGPLRDAVARSHDDAKQALADLRDVVRGLYPAVLDARGLDAALSGIVARSPIPARLRVDLPRRAPVAVEAVAYFVVSEALSNVAKHAHASRVEITVNLLEDGGRLRVAVVDDGRGGARPGRGTGLRGLAQRVSSVDGTLKIDSPEGGPTTIVAELPCES